jgi:glycosyltransferase involved in cell wall biosynthesis
MRLVIDMQGAQTESRYRGIGRYTTSLVEAIVRDNVEHDIVLALNGLLHESVGALKKHFELLLPADSIKVWYAPPGFQESNPGGVDRRARAEMIREAALASYCPDIILVTSLFEGFAEDAVTSIGRYDRKTPVMVILYDLIPLLNPKQYLESNPVYEKYYRGKIESLNKAAGLLAISRFSANEGAEVLNRPTSQIFNISTASSSAFSFQAVSDRERHEVCVGYGFKDDFVLYAGGADDRKNLPRLIEAYAGLNAEIRATTTLVIAGRLDGRDKALLRDRAEKSKLGNDELMFTGYVSDEALATLYRLCRVFVFPSWHEGFGLPALEAMSCGAPVIGAGNTSLPEVIDNPDALFDPFDRDAMAAKISHVLTDENFRQSLIEKGLTRAPLFSWSNSAKKAVAAISAIYRGYQSNSAVAHTERTKPVLAMVTPLPPLRTGIGYYSRALLPFISRHYHVVVITDQSEIDCGEETLGFEVKNINWLRRNGHSIDRFVYQMGNSPFHEHMLELMDLFPGIVVMHDFFLSSLYGYLEGNVKPGAWQQELQHSHGYRSLMGFDNQVDHDGFKARYPSNLTVLEKATGLIFHSEYSRNLLSEFYSRASSWPSVVIPHLKELPDVRKPGKARQDLGFGESDLIVCSFGFIDKVKCSREIFEAWDGIDFPKDRVCRLIFVGENHGGEYGFDFQRRIKKSSLSDTVLITGWVDDETYNRYLEAADIAVQLRSESKGETSGTIIDCMSVGLPAVVNSVGSFAELASEGAVLLKESFSVEELRGAISQLLRDDTARSLLGIRAREVIKTAHSPQDCAEKYRDFIELISRRARFNPAGLYRALMQNTAVSPDDKTLVQLASCIAETFPARRARHRLFLDITATNAVDHRAGIERVAKSLSLELLLADWVTEQIEPIYLTRSDDGLLFRHARAFTSRLLDIDLRAFADDAVEFLSGDVILSLDLSDNCLPEAVESGVYKRLQLSGVKVYSVVYDLLPLQNPECFPPGADITHRRWLDSIAAFDGAVCISKSVADSLGEWVKAQRGELSPAFRIGWFHLGSDVAVSSHNSSISAAERSLLARLEGRISFLMVGTIEPRKAYFQSLEAFSMLWKSGVDFDVVIVGREGWTVLDDSQRRDIPLTLRAMRNSDEFGKRLHWISDGSDELLNQLYATASALIAASVGEGFGLPLVESQRHGLPVIARDLPVFREVADSNTVFFKAASSQDLATALQAWISQNSSGLVSRPDSRSAISWKSAARRVRAFCFDN